MQQGEGRGVILAHTSWVALTVRGPHKENLAQRWLANAGLETVLPMEVRRGRSRHGKRERYTFKRPAMRGYLFLRIPGGADPDQLIADARDVPVIGRPVGFNGSPCIIPEGWLDRLNPNVLDPEDLELPPLTLQPGQAVMLNAAAGAFEGYRGLVERVSNREVRILIQSLHAALRVNVPERAIRLAA